MTYYPRSAHRNAWVQIVLGDGSVICSVKKKIIGLHLHKYHDLNGH
jgi:hypothetical protein